MWQTWYVYVWHSPCPAWSVEWSAWPTGRPLNGRSSHWCPPCCSSRRTWPACKRISDPFEPTKMQYTLRESSSSSYVCVRMCMVLWCNRTLCLWFRAIFIAPRPKCNLFRGGWCREWRILCMYVCMAVWLECIERDRDKRVVTFSGIRGAGTRALARTYVWWVRLLWCVMRLGTLYWELGWGIGCRIRYVFLPQWLGWYIM